MKRGYKRKPIHFYFISGNIINKDKIRKHKIDAVVNAARPTLMGSEEEGVDKSIHEAIDELLDKKRDPQNFNDKIRAELDGTQNMPEHTIRCRRGKAVVTKGYGLCDYVIHAVGTKYPKDYNTGAKRSKINCPSSIVQGLESCYYEIVEILKQHSDIRNIAVPLIGTGNYGFPIEYALRIALASVYNAVDDWYNKDPEMFSMENNGEDSAKPYIKVYFYIYDKSVISKDEYKKILKMIWQFRRYIGEGKKISFQSSVLTQFQYLAEIRVNDKNRGYFAIARNFRFALIAFRILFSPLLLFKEIFGKKSWQGRRCAVEIFSIIKALTGPLFWGLSLFVRSMCLQTVLMAISVAFLLDTVSYLLALIVLADIQRPSANIIRSMILLLVNYVEVQMDMAFICYTFYRLKSIEVSFSNALTFSFFGKQYEIMGFSGQVFGYLREGLSFLFITFAFGYFLNHVRLRKFSS